MRFLIFILALVIPLLTAQSHFSTASAGVSFASENNGLSAAAHAGGEVKIRNRRMYAMCPPLFQRIGTECYSMPEQRSSWLEAHFFCKDKNSKLAEPQKFSNRKLSSYLQHHDAQMGLNDPIWIGATYDWQSNVWQWSISGKNLSYDAFSQMDPESRKNLENHCAVYDPNLQYRWSARSCPDKHRFICQHKMPKVSEKNRYKVYDRWNATYPNQMANEVILEVIDRKSKNSGKINRTVQAVDSKEEMPVRNRRPPGNMQRRRRPSQKQSVNLPSENDTNYQQSSVHPNDINYRPTGRRHRVRTTTSTTPASPMVGYNEIPPHVTEAPANVQSKARPERPDRARTNQDRKLQQQRLKEQRRLQRKRERQEKMRLRKQQQQQRLREEHKQPQNDQQHNQLDELRQKENEAEQRDRRRPQQQQDDEARQQIALQQQLQHQQENEARQQMARQQQQRDLEQRQRELSALKQQHADDEKKRQEDQEEEHLRNERIRKQHERDAQIRMEREQAARKLQEERDAEDLKNEQVRLAEEQRLKDEYEENLKQAQNERERQLQQEQEQKRLTDEHNRRQLELEAKQREENIKREQEEEEKRMELQRLEENDQLERSELQRLHEESRRRKEVQRKREEEIARREADQRQIEAEEERIRQELEASEKERLRQHEEDIKREEEAAKAKEESKRRAEEEKQKEREQRFDVLKRADDERVRQELLKKKRNYTERIARLSPEDQKKFFEMRKRRKNLKNKQARENGVNSNNEAFIPNSAE